MCHSVHFGVRSVVVNAFASFFTFVFSLILAEICTMSINIDDATLADNSIKRKVSRFSAEHLANFRNFTI